VIRNGFNGKRESERKPLSLKLKTGRRRKRDRYNYNANDEIPLKPLKAGEIGDLRQVKRGASLKGKRLRRHLSWHGSQTISEQLLSLRFL
jgi:hypothetical protein